MKKLKEQDIQRQLKMWLELEGFLVIKHNNVGIVKPNGSYIPTHQPGVADLICCAPNGRFVAVEVKQPGKKPTEEQRNFLKNVNATGGLGVWVSSLDELRMDLIEGGVKKPSEFR